MKVKRIISITLILIMAMSTMTYAATLHAPDGRKINVYESEVGSYLNVGWYQAPVTVMYAEDDRTIVVYESEVKAYEKVGWTDGKSIITLYAPDGRTQNIPRSQRATYLKLGWFKEPSYYNVVDRNAYIKYYPNSKVPDFGHSFFSTHIHTATQNGIKVYVYTTNYDAARIWYPILLVYQGWEYIPSSSGYKDDGSHVDVFMKGNAGIMVAYYQKLNQLYIGYGTY